MSEISTKNEIAAWADSDKEDEFINYLLTNLRPRLPILEINSINKLLIESVPGTKFAVLLEELNKLNFNILEIVGNSMKH